VVKEEKESVSSASSKTMKPKHGISTLSSSEIERLAGPVRNKAEQFYRNGCVSFKGRAGGSLYFEVRSSDASYSVIYRMDSAKWLCDCKWASLKTSPYCSHVIAAQMLVNSNKQFFDSATTSTTTTDKRQA